MLLYHATLAKNVASIKKNGLRVSNGRRKSYDGSDTNFVETAQQDWDNSEADESVVVFRVDDRSLVKKDLAPDRNVIFNPEDDIYSFEYPHGIPAEFLEICER